MTLRYDYLGLTWNITHKNILNMIYGWLVVKYNSLYLLTSTSLLLSFLSRLVVVLIGVGLFQSDSNPNILWIYLVYLDWSINIPFSLWLILSLRKNIISHIVLISNMATYHFLLSRYLGVIFSKTRPWTPILVSISF